MSQLSDWQRRRQEYLSAQGNTVIDLITLVGWTIYTGAHMVNNAFLYARQGNGDYLALTILLGMATVVYSSHIWWMFRSLKTMPYVPPITAGSLPANEILVRGVAEPTCRASNILLRAARHQMTATEELLRISYH